MMTIGSRATILRVGKPLPQSIVGQQSEIVRFVSESFPVVRLADGREFIMDASNLACSSNKSEENLRAGDLVQISLTKQQGWIYRLVTSDIAEVSIEGELRKLHINEIALINLPQGTHWLESKMRHYERIIPRLANKTQHWQLARSMQAEYEQVLATLGINDEEVEF